MPKSKPTDKDLAIKRGLQFIYESACDRENFGLYGHDYLFCFSCIASTSRKLELRQTSLSMGRELARRWRRDHPAVPIDADADDVANLIIGSYAAGRLGVPDSALRQHLRETVGRFKAQDYFCFDPLIEAPPADVPDYCECGEQNTRGRKKCRGCAKRLGMVSRYAVWLDALFRSFIGQRYVGCLGASFAEVIKWLPAMRPYPKYDEKDNDEYYWAVYAITHVVYTLNNYSAYKLSPSWLPHEYQLLKQTLKQATVIADPEMTGELLDSLKSFGLGETNPLVRRAQSYLLSQQNADGSWGVTETDDVYQRYHPTWTVIDGLRDYAWRGKRLSVQTLLPLLKRQRVIYQTNSASQRRRRRSAD